MSTPVAKKDSISCITCITDNSELRQNVIEKGGRRGSHTHTHYTRGVVRPPSQPNARLHSLTNARLHSLLKMAGRLRRPPTTTPPAFEFKMSTRGRLPVGKSDLTRSILNVKGPPTPLNTRQPPSTAANTPQH